MLLWEILQRVDTKDVFWPHKLCSPRGLKNSRKPPIPPQEPVAASLIIFYSDVIVFKF